MWICGGSWCISQVTKSQIHQIHQVSLRIEKTTSPKKSSEKVTKSVFITLALICLKTVWIHGLEALCDTQELDELLQGTCAGDRLFAELPDTEVWPNKTRNGSTVFGNETKSDYLYTKQVLYHDLYISVSTNQGWVQAVLSLI